jgi:hypothetical protein
MQFAKSIAAFTCAVAAAACAGFEHKSTPTSPGTAVSSLIGVWNSGNIVPSPDSCSNFQWNATEQTNTSARGSFSATCAGNLTLQGTAEGTLNGSIVNWKASGNATAPDLPSCSFALTGTAELGTDSIRIPYSGDTCLGKVSGIETLHKK